MFEPSLIISLLDKFGGMGIGVILGLMMYKLCDKHLERITNKLEELTFRVQGAHNHQIGLQNQALKSLERLENQSRSR